MDRLVQYSIAVLVGSCNQNNLLVHNCSIDTNQNIHRLEETVAVSIRSLQLHPEYLVRNLNRKLVGNLVGRTVGMMEGMMVGKMAGKMVGRTVLEQMA